MFVQFLGTLCRSTYKVKPDLTTTFQIAITCLNFYNINLNNDHMSTTPTCQQRLLFLVRSLYTGLTVLRKSCYVFQRRHTMFFRRHTTFFNDVTLRYQWNHLEVDQSPPCEQYHHVMQSECIGLEGKNFFRYFNFKRIYFFQKYFTYIIHRSCDF